MEKMDYRNKAIKNINKMTNSVETIGKLIDKQNVSFISSVDENGFQRR